MQSISLLIAVIAVAVSTQPDRSAWDPTTRDLTAKCERMAKYAPENERCDIFYECCPEADPLNGDKCLKAERICQEDVDDKFVFTCKYSNCTEMITTTTTTTTPSPRQINGGSSLALCLSAALLPRFLF